MLVFADNLVLSADDAALPPGVPLIGWRNIVTFGNITADNEDADYPATNLANPATDQEWRADDASPSPGTIHINVTVDEVDPIDYVGIARHNFGSAAIAVTIEKYVGLDDNSPAAEVWEVLAGPQVPPNDEPLLFQFTPDSMERIRITLAQGGDLPRAAVVYVGKLLLAERSMVVDEDFTPPRFGRKTETVSGRSDRGDFLGRVVLSRWTETRITFKHFRPAWYRQHFDPFIAAAEQNVPFFFAWSPVSYPQEVAYCWLTADPVPAINPATGRFGVSLPVGGILE